MYVKDAPPAKPLPPSIVEAEEHIHGDVDTAPNKTDITCVLTSVLLQMPMMDLDYSRKIVGTRGSNQYTDEVPIRRLIFLIAPHPTPISSSKII
jgi:hypothetical protein